MNEYIEKLQDTSLEKISEAYKEYAQTDDFSVLIDAYNID